MVPAPDTMTALGPDTRSLSNELSKVLACRKLPNALCKLSCVGSKNYSKRGKPFVAFYGNSKY